MYKDVKKIIKKAMNDLMQKNSQCDYDIITKDGVIFLKDTYALDSYMRAYELSRQYDEVSCFMAPMGKRAVLPVFTIQNGCIFLSGLEVFVDLEFNGGERRKKLLFLFNTIRQKKLNRIDYCLNEDHLFCVEKG